MTRRFYKLISLLIVICVFFSFSACSGSQESEKGDSGLQSSGLKDSVVESDYLAGPYKVERVVDGDTFIADIDGKDIRVRVLCIDTPESVAPEETGKLNTDEGEIASEKAKELLEGETVYLEYDQETEDQYGRTLAYVYFDDLTCFEEVMISEGLARVVVYEPNDKHAREYYKLQDKAKENGTGFWGTGYFY